MSYVVWKDGMPQFPSTAEERLMAGMRLSAPRAHAHISGVTDAPALEFPWVSTRTDWFGSRRVATRRPKVRR